MPERSEVGRLETFSDGVFAIAATLLILNVSSRVPELAGGRAWLAYAAYAVTFVNMGIIWVNHHTAFTQIGRVNRTFLMLNVFFLMFVAFIPYPTGLLTEHLGRPGQRGPLSSTAGPSPPPPSAPTCGGSTPPVGVTSCGKTQPRASSPASLAATSWARSSISRPRWLPWSRRTWPPRCTRRLPFSTSQRFAVRRPDT